jgi:phosphoribosylanthranilate isomerase
MGQRKEGTEAVGAVHVKVCGITRLEDARRAVDLGASAIGIVFWPESPRFVDPYTARAIVRALPPFVTAVGVFVNQPREFVEGVASLARLGAVQLHGEESAAYCTDLRDRVIKAVRVGPDLIGSVSAYPQEIVMLVDADDPARRGGTGRTVDWGAAGALAAIRPTILSGGLKPENVEAAIRFVRPFGVDVSSGVESAPGIKDRSRLEAFFAAVRDGSAGIVAREGQR